MAAAAGVDFFAGGIGGVDYFDRAGTAFDFAAARVAGGDGSSASRICLSPQNLVLLYIAFASIKACHEMGHAISCKKFGKQSGTGGEVHVIGIMLLVFTPVPYVDASSSWALDEQVASGDRRGGGHVGGTGDRVHRGDGLGAHARDALAARVRLQRHVRRGVLDHRVQRQPALRYDGYYILSDMLEIPNLATRSKDYIYYLVKRYVWNVRQARNPAHSTSEQIWLFVYAIASFIMRVSLSRSASCST